MRAIISWRDQIGEGKVLLRDVIDLEATYGGTEPQGEDASATKSAEAETAARETARTRRPGARPNAEAETEDEDDFDEGALSLSAMEATVRDGVLETFDQIAESYERLRPCRSSGWPACSTTSRSMASSICVTSRRARRWSIWSIRSTSTRTGSSTWSSSCTRSTGA